MALELLAQHSRAVREAFAIALDCSPDDFSSEALTIVDRPASAEWPYTAMALTFGTGTVLSIDPAYREVAEAHRPREHFRAAYPDFLEQIAREGARRGVRLVVGPPNLLFGLAEMVPEAPPPPGFELHRVDAAWMAKEQSSGRFENAVGEPGREARESRNRLAIGAFDQRGAPAALAGVFMTSGLHEIGVDVLRSDRGKGLAPLVVAAAVRAILEQDGIPLYGCRPTNIRSQRTAIAAGFLPVCSDAFVNAPSD